MLQTQYYVLVQQTQLSAHTGTYFSPAEPLLTSFGPKALVHPHVNLPDERGAAGGGDREH